MQRGLIFTFVAGLTLLFGSCVTSGDIQDLRQATDDAFIRVIESQENYEERTAEIIADSTKTAEERIEAIAEANKERLDEVADAAEELGSSQEAVLRAIRDRTVAVGKNVASLDWMELLAALLGTALAGGAGGTLATNHIRDTRRAMRGEQTTIPTKQA